MKIFYSRILALSFLLALLSLFFNDCTAAKNLIQENSSITPEELHQKVQEGIRSDRNFLEEKGENRETLLASALKINRQDLAQVIIEANKQAAFEMLLALSSQEQFKKNEFIHAKIKDLLKDHCKPEEPYEFASDALYPLVKEIIDDIEVSPKEIFYLLKKSIEECDIDFFKKLLTKDRVIFKVLDSTIISSILFQVSDETAYQKYVVFVEAVVSNSKPPLISDKDTESALRGVENPWKIKAFSEMLKDLKLETDNHGATNKYIVTDLNKLMEKTIEKMKSKQREIKSINRSLKNSSAEFLKAQKNTAENEKKAYIALFQELLKKSVQLPEDISDELYDEYDDAYAAITSILDELPDSFFDQGSKILKATVYRGDVSSYQKLKEKNIEWKEKISGLSVVLMKAKEIDSENLKETQHYYDLVQPLVRYPEGKIDNKVLNYVITRLKSLPIPWIFTRAIELSSPEVKDVLIQNVTIAGKKYSLMEDVIELLENTSDTLKDEEKKHLEQDPSAVPAEKKQLLEEKRNLYKALFQELIKKGIQLPEIILDDLGRHYVVVYNALIEIVDALPESFFSTEQASKILDESVFLGDLKTYKKLRKKGAQHTKKELRKKGAPSTKEFSLLHKILRGVSEKIRGENQNIQPYYDFIDYAVTQLGINLDKETLTYMCDWFNRVPVAKASIKIIQLLPVEKRDILKELIAPKFDSEKGDQTLLQRVQGKIKTLETKGDENQELAVYKELEQTITKKMQQLLHPTKQRTGKRTTKRTPPTKKTLHERQEEKKARQAQEQDKVETEKAEGQSTQKPKVGTTGRGPNLAEEAAKKQKAKKAAKKAAEAEDARKKAEAEEAQRKAQEEAARLEEAERIDRERVAEEVRKAKEVKEAAKAEKARKKAEAEEAQRKAKEEAARLEAERIEQERVAEEERKAKEAKKAAKAEETRKKAEAEEAQRKAKEEAARLEAERIERERVAKEAKKAEKAAKLAKALSTLQGKLTQLKKKIKNLGKTLGTLKTTLSV